MGGKILYNVTEWIEENKKDFHPPICNRLMHGQQLKVMFVGGPNTRSDYHIEKGEELFFQVKGDMCLKIMERGQPKDIHIKEGEMFLLPGCIPHSPQRVANTVGLVIERERFTSELDCLRYYCADNKEVLWEKWFYCRDLVVDLPPAVREYKASEQFRTQQPVKGFVKDPPYPLDVSTVVDEPFQFRTWLNANKTEIHSQGHKWVFKDDNQTGVIVYGKGENSDTSSIYDIWMWQLEGLSVVKTCNKTYELRGDDSILIPCNEKYEASRPENSLCLFVYMDPRKTK